MWSKQLLTVYAAFICAYALPGFTAMQAYAATEPQVKIVPLSDDIHMLMGMGGNIAITTGADGTFIIDDDMPPLAEKIEAAIRTLSDEPVRMVFNTHWHFDHTGGNEHFGGQGAVIIAHENVRQRMNSKQLSALFDNETPPSPNAALPVVTFSDTLTLHLNGHTINAIHLPPAHTDGDAIVIFADANIAHLGDLFFNRMYPVIDISAGGSIQGMIAAVDLIAPMLNSDTQVVPGHGQLSDLEGLREFQLMLATVLERVQAMVDEGKTADEVVKLAPTADFDELWAWQFMPPERWTRLVYDSVVEYGQRGD